MSKHNVLNLMLYESSLEARNWRLTSQDREAVHWRLTSSDEDAVVWRRDTKNGVLLESEVSDQQYKTIYWGFFLLWTASFICLLVAFPVAIAIAGVTLNLQLIELT